MTKEQGKQAKAARKKPRDKLGISHIIKQARERKDMVHAEIVGQGNASKKGRARYRGLSKNRARFI